MITILDIDVTKIEKNRIKDGKSGKGKYLKLVLKPNRDGVDRFGNSGMIVHSVTKEERAQGVRGSIVGNYSEVGSDDRDRVPVAAVRRSTLPDPEPDDGKGDLPF